MFASPPSSNPFTYNQFPRVRSPLFLSVCVFVFLLFGCTLYYLASSVHSYSLSSSSSLSPTQIQINNLMVEWRTQLDKELELTRKLNQKTKNEFTLKTTIERLEAIVKDQNRLIEEMKGGGGGHGEGTIEGNDNINNAGESPLPNDANAPSLSSDHLFPSQSELKKAEEDILAHTNDPSASTEDSPLFVPPVPLESISAPIGVPVLLFCYNRANNLKLTLDSLLSHQPPSGFPVYVSQQGEDAAVTDVIQSYGNKIYPLKYHHIPTPKPSIEEITFPHYYKISSHYHSSLSKLYDDLNYERVIIVEDDFTFAPDFFDYFLSMQTLMDKDTSIYCVSAWNDNGRSPLASNPKQFHRTDCFPGLGWMMRREIWDELKPKWPEGFWDDWMRLPEQRRGRSCIYPEVNRVYTFGAQGASQGQFFNTFLKDIQLNKVPVKYEELDLNYLLKENYSHYLGTLLNNATRIENIQHISPSSHSNDVNDQGGDEYANAKEYMIQYNDLNDLTHRMKGLSLMDDHKDQIPRTSFKGMVPFRTEGRDRVWLVPKDMDIQKDLLQDI